MNISTSSEVGCLNSHLLWEYQTTWCFLSNNYLRYKPSARAVCELATSTNHYVNIQLQNSFPLSLIHAIFFFQINPKGGVMASWLVGSTPDRAVRIRTLVGTLCCVHGRDTLLSQCLSPPKCINGYQRP